MACPTGKRRYRDRIAAALALAAWSGDDKYPVREYRCPKCAGWHLTSRARRAS